MDKSKLARPIRSLWRRGLPTSTAPQIHLPLTVNATSTIPIHPITVGPVAAPDGAKRWFLPFKTWVGRSTAVLLADILSLYCSTIKIPLRQRKVSCKSSVPLWDSLLRPLRAVGVATLTCAIILTQSFTPCSTSSLLGLFCCGFLTTYKPPKPKF